MPWGTDRATLRKMYPTLGSYMKAVEEAGSQLRLAEKLGMNSATLHYHKKWLKEGRRTVAGPGPQNWMCRLTNDELDKRVKELYGSSMSDVKVYRLDEVSE